MTQSPKRVLLLGATGTAGAGALRALHAAGHGVTCITRPGRAGALPKGTRVIEGALSDAAFLAQTMAPGFDAVISCLASRSGAPEDAWRIDHAAHMGALHAALTAEIPHFIQLSAICVQKPMLEFQRAKLAFEAALTAAPITHSIIRPTAFFKSLSGQVARLKAGKPFLVFGDGMVTACKPISDDDLGRYIAAGLTDESLQNRILPIGGPGPAITPMDQGAALFERLNLAPKYKRVPVGMMDAIIGGLSLTGRISPKARAKAELARIGRYYATESMLLWDAEAQRYDAEATPEYGSDTLFDFYDDLISGRAKIDLADHAVF
ncbi:NAD(P)H-binding protein [Roseovarius sp. LXJ103]|uniref:NAD(P)H-binding protein n=1 Tax=Roseovarius carneus TaxID=2853164 RepID=UPI000D61803A|nr:NAD(P)H-binding protein [Roseovarius carneus]MBZ8119014.1 NAD(P)H-binding protein [Roseovarius carneus]PWE35336.1 epimerase [Pelagicola sp. LXJ1103]